MSVSVSVSSIVILFRHRDHGVDLIFLACLQLAPMSTTTDLDTAIAYSISDDPKIKHSLIFKILTENNLQRGADLQWLSAFPNEAEVLYPPVTYLQPTREKISEDIEVDGYTFTVLEVKPTIP